MTPIALTLLVSLVTGPGRAEVETDLRDAPAALMHAPAARPGWLPTPAGSAAARAGALPSICESLGSYTWQAAGKPESRYKATLGRAESEALSRLARWTCRAAGGRGQEPGVPAVRSKGPGGVVASVEARKPFAYEPRTWLPVHRLTVSRGPIRELEFWPADPRDLPGAPPAAAFVRVSAIFPARGSRAVSFRITPEGTVEPDVWLVAPEGGSHAPLARSDVQSALAEELAFWRGLADELLR